MADPKEHHHHGDHEHHHHGEHEQHHHGDHEQHHHGDRQSSLSFEQKLVKRLEHWIAHNDAHADTYREWADRTADTGMAGVGALLEEAASVTEDISRKLEEAIREIPEG